MKGSLKSRRKQIRAERRKEVRAERQEAKGFIRQALAQHEQELQRESHEAWIEEIFWSDLLLEDPEIHKVNEPSCYDEQDYADIEPDWGAVISEQEFNTQAALTGEEMQ